MKKDEALAIMCSGIKNFRTRRKLSQEELGRIMDCGKANVSNIENQKSFPAMEALFTLAENGMTLEEMFGPEIAQKLSCAKHDDSPIERAKKIKAEMLSLLDELDRTIPT